MNSLFVIVDPSLSKRQQFVQGAHAVAQHLVDYPDSDWKNGTLVMLKADCSVDHIADILAQESRKYSVFYEPYYNNMMTAVSCLNIKDLVANLKLI